MERPPDWKFVADPLTRGGWREVLVQWKATQAVGSLLENQSELFRIAEVSW